MARRGGGVTAAPPPLSAESVSGNGGSKAASTRLRSPLPTRQRRPAFVGLAFALIVGLGSAGAWLYTEAGAKTPVVMVAQAVPEGQTVERADLTTVAVAGPLTAIAAVNIDSVVGQTAAVDLLPDMLLQRSMVTDSDPLGPDEAIVGVLTQPGQIPAEPLAAGDVVQVLRLPAGNAAGGEGGGQGAAVVLVEDAEVFTARSDPAVPGGTVISLVVERDVAPAVAAASGAGLAALVRVAP